MVKQGIVSEYDEFIEVLKARRLYDPNLLYVGIDGKDVPELLRIGGVMNKLLGWDHSHTEDHLDSEILELREHIPHAKPEDYIFAGAESDLMASESETVVHPFYCAGQYLNPVIAIYDGTKFERACYTSITLEMVKTFLDSEKKLEALVAVAYLQY